MSYNILTVANTNQLIIRSADNPHNALTLTDHRDLLLLRARLNAYLDTLQADGQIDSAPAEPGELISAIQARAEAEAQGHLVENSALRMAMTRGSIPGATKRGGRWYLPRQAFEEWLQAHLHRK